MAKYVLRAGKDIQTFVLWTIGLEEMNWRGIPNPGKLERFMLFGLNGIKYSLRRTMNNHNKADGFERRIEVKLFLLIFAVFPTRSELYFVCLSST